MGMAKGGLNWIIQEKRRYLWEKREGMVLLNLGYDMN